MITYIQILGPFNTGTNLLCKIIIKFIKINNLSKTYKLNSQGHTLIWKHTINNIVNDIEIINNKDITKKVFICCYKNPYSWFNSILKAPYNIKLSNNNIFEKITLSRKDNNYKCNNLLQLWLDYYNNYKILLESYTYNTILFQYQKILQIDNKSLIIEYIYNILINIFTDIDTEHINNFIINNLDNILSKPSKTHGNSYKSNKDAYDNYFININKMKNIINDYNKKNDNSLQDTINNISTLINYYELNE